MVTAGQGAPEFARAIASHLQRHPRAVSLHTDAGTISYGALAELTDAAHLDGLPPGPVAVPSVKASTTVAAILSGLAAGRAVLLPSAGAGPAVVDDLCTRVGAVAVFSAEHGRWLVTSAASQSPAARAAADPLLADACFVLATSGSTGAPKLVPLSGEAVSRFVDWAARQFRLGTDSVVLNYAPLSFDLCLLEIWATLACGGRAVLADPDRAVWPSYLSDLIASAAPTLVQGVPLLYQVLAEAAGRSYPSVRHVIVTGDHAPAPLRDQLPGLFPAACYYNIYGCTETNDSFLHEFRPDQAPGPRSLPIGQPLPGVRDRITEDGELLVATPFQTRGYLGGPNDERFMTLADGVYFRTGDLVRREPSGLIYLIGRNDFQVKIRGVRVNLEQVERALAASEEVLEAAAIAVGDGGGGGRSLCAVVRTRPETGLTPLTIRSHCAEHVPRAMIPARISLTHDPLPRTATGKIDRKTIKLEFERGLFEG